MLRKQLAALQGPKAGSVGAASPKFSHPPPTVSKPAETFSTRAASAIKTEAKLSLEQATILRREAKKTDDAVAGYLAGHPLSQDIAAALWAGKPAVGMPEEALNLIGSTQVKADDTAGKTVVFYDRRMDNRETKTYLVILVAGQVASVDYSYRGGVQAVEGSLNRSNISR